LIASHGVRLQLKWVYLRLALTINVVVVVIVSASAFRDESALFTEFRLK